MQRLRVLFASSFLLGSLSVGTLAIAADNSLATPAQLIVPQRVSVAEQKKCINENEQKFCAEMRITLETTSIEWLDRALLARVDLAAAESTQRPSDLSAYLQQIKQQAEDWVVEQYKDIQTARGSDDPYSVGYEYLDSIRFIAQRNNIASFKQFFYSFSGGAHGMHNTRYLVFDLNTQRQLLLADILQPFVHDKLLEELRKLYLENYAEYAQTWLSENPAEQVEILLTDNFIFNENGLTLSYPPYVLGPYSEGEMQLSLDYNALKEIVKPEYLLVY